MTAQEVNFDGLVGPTHNYGGLSLGNLASMTNLGGESNPKAAVLQGLKKMRALMDLGVAQGVLLPHDRPHVATLRRFGFTGKAEQIVDTAGKAAPSFLINCASASAMWTANAATVSPSADASDGRIHFTPANLGSMFHRSLEAAFTGQQLRAIFSDDSHFAHHVPVPFGGSMGDEGAANHGRFAHAHGDKGIELFVYGRSAFEKLPEEQRFLPRQALEASHAVATNHKLGMGGAVFVRQSAKAINAGAFHNDVVSVTNGSVLFYHEEAFEDKTQAIDHITRACATIELEPVFVEVPADQVSLEDAVSSYLFNSQLVTLPGGGMALILPKDAEENPHTKAFVDQAVAGNTPISEAHYLDLKQSMRNGGGPACLRLRVVMTEKERKAIDSTCLLTEDRLVQLEAWAEKYYRDRLMPEDVADPKLLTESRTALDALTDIVGVGSLYDFQR